MTALEYKHIDHGCIAITRACESSPVAMVYPGPDANRLAREFAAAPELLAVLEALLSMYERGYVHGVSTAPGNAFLDQMLSARAAIAKAKGGA